jgi:hypothetical protein
MTYTVIVTYIYIHQRLLLFVTLEILSAKKNARMILPWLRTICSPKVFREDVFLRYIIKIVILH